MTPVFVFLICHLSPSKKGNDLNTTYLPAKYSPFSKADLFIKLLCVSVSPHMLCKHQHGFERNMDTAD